MMQAEILERGIDFNANVKMLFTPVFFRIKKILSRFAVIFGGAASGKSYAVHQHELIEIMKPGQGDTLIMRKNAADLRESCYKLLINLIAKYDLNNYFRCVFGGDHRKITCIHTGRSIIFRGIDDPDKLKSIVGIKRIIMEEASQFDYEDFLELNRRARGLDNIQILLILNPISENHWIKTKMVDEGSHYFSDTTVIKCTYKDNKNYNGKSFLTAKDIAELERLKSVDENQYRIYALGEWGIDNKENKFCWAFEKAKHITTGLEHDAENITWVSFDFNIEPITCIIAQLYPDEKRCNILECIKLDNSDIYKLCDRLTAWKDYEIAWQITGDATGQNRSAMTRDNLTYYKIIQSNMFISSQQIKVPSKNPLIEENRVLVNAILKNWDIAIDNDKCQPLIYDMQYTEINREGKIIKDRTTESRKSDFLDCFRYLCNIAIRPHFSYFETVAEIN